MCCSFSPFVWIRVYLTCVYVSQVWYASRVSEFALQLQPAPVPFRLLTRLSLRIEYPDYLPDMACIHTVLFPNALEGISLMWPTDDASISNGLRRKQGFLLVIAMMEMNERCWSRLGSSTFWATEDGKSSGWQGWYSMELPPRNLLRSWPSFTKTHSWSFSLAFSYRHDHHSTSITNLTNKKSRDKIFLFDFVSTFVLFHVN